MEQCIEQYIYMSGYLVLKMPKNNNNKCKNNSSYRQKNLRFCDLLHILVQTKNDSPVLVLLPIAAAVVAFFLVLKLFVIVCRARAIFLKYIWFLFDALKYLFDFHVRAHIPNSFRISMLSLSVHLSLDCMSSLDRFQFRHFQCYVKMYEFVVRESAGAGASAHTVIKMCCNCMCYLWAEWSSVELRVARLLCARCVCAHWDWTKTHRVTV